MGAIAPEVREVIARYVAILRALGVPPTRVVLYGSHARGNAHELSDIDLLVVSPAVAKLPPPEVPRMKARARTEVDAPIHALWTTPEKLARATPTTFIGEILRTGIDLAA
jgi:predicted nucleotidyltransferase